MGVWAERTIENNRAVRLRAVTQLMIKIRVVIGAFVSVSCLNTGHGLDGREKGGGGGGGGEGGGNGG